MPIARIHIEGFKRFLKFDLMLTPSFNVIVGDNETGKSSILEAIDLVLTCQYDGRAVQYGIDPYLFHAPTVAEYFVKRQRGENCAPPRVLIEAYFVPNDADPGLTRLRGTNNTRNEDCPGLTLTIEVDGDHADALKAHAADDTNPTVLPVEFYKVTWRSFANNGVTSRGLPVRAKTIDTSLSRTHRGPNRYVAQRIDDILTDAQHRDLSLAYKKLRHRFTQEPGVAAINDGLRDRGNPATTKSLSVQMDMSSRTTWDTSIAPHLDDLPFDCAGKGERCRVQMRLAILGAASSQVLLVEEPENHLSHANLNRLMDEIKRDCADRQVIVTTHSAFVLNKMGLDNLSLISFTGATGRLSQLTPDTRDYFMKLPGYDTLRLILARRSILVEGPSDELIVQRAYRDRYGKLPLEDGVDVIAVGSLAFKRFLEIAALLELDVRVVTDNDGNVGRVRAKYGDYLSGARPNIKVCFDENEGYRTLEPQLLRANSLPTLNSILGTSHADDRALLAYMDANKTDCALRLFETASQWVAPPYIERAID